MNLQIEQIIHPVLFALSQSIPKIEQIIYPVLFALSKILGVGVGPDGGWGPMVGGPLVGYGGQNIGRSQNQGLLKKKFLKKIWLRDWVLMWRWGRLVGFGGQNSVLYRGVV